MTAISERAVSHYRKTLAAEKPTVEVPEWPDDAGAPTRLAFVKPTMAIHNRILKATEDEGQAAGIVEALISRAVDPVTGKKAFHATDRNDLLNRVDPDVLFGIFSRLRDAEGSQTLEEIEQD